MPYTRVAVVQLPEDLVAHYLPEAATQLILDQCADLQGAGRSSGVLATIIDSLRRDIYELAKSQAEICLREVLRFAGHRKVDVVVFPDFLLQPGWVELLELEQRDSEIPAIVMPSFVLPRPPDAQTLQPFGERTISLSTHRVTLRAFHPEQRIDIPGGDGHVLSVVSAGSRHRSDPGLSTRLDHLQTVYGVVTAVADTKGHSRFYARVWKDGSRSKISDRRPLGAPLYQMPPGNAGINILDIDLAQQKGKWLDTGGFHTRSVTVAPLIPRGQFPEYMRLLKGKLASDYCSEWIHSEKTREVRFRTLERIRNPPRLSYTMFNQKIMEVEVATKEDEGLEELQKYAKPGDFQRLVDAILVDEPLNLPRIRSVHSALVGALRVIAKDEGRFYGDFEISLRQLQRYFGSILFATESATDLRRRSGVFYISAIFRGMMLVERAQAGSFDADQVVPDLLALLTNRARRFLAEQTEWTLDLPKEQYFYISNLRSVLAPPTVLAAQAQPIDLPFSWSAHSKFIEIDFSAELKADLVGTINKILLGLLEETPQDTTLCSYELFEDHRLLDSVVMRSRDEQENTPMSSLCSSKLQVIAGCKPARARGLPTRANSKQARLLEVPNSTHRTILEKRILAITLMLRGDRESIVLGLRLNLEAQALDLFKDKWGRYSAQRGLSVRQRRMKTVLLSARQAALRSYFERTLARFSLRPDKHWKLIPEILDCQDQLLEIENEINLLSRL